MAGFKLPQIKFILIMFVVFVAVTLVGMMLHENVRKAEAKSLGYESHYSRGWGQLFFRSDKMQIDFQPIWEGNRKAIRSKSYFKDKDKWDVLVDLDRKDHAMIELSGLIFTFSLSLAGLILLFLRRKRRDQGFGLIDWTGVILSLFIVKELVTSLTWILLRTMLCDHAKFAQYFHLPVFGTEWFILGYSVLFSLFVLIRFVPRNRVLPFVIAGIPGGMTGIVLWCFVIGKMVF
jgi:hypothetical protein